MGEDKTYSEEVIRMITEGVDKSGADQVQTFLSIMSKFIMIEDGKQQFRLKQLHSPQNPDKGVLHFIKCYRLQHQPFSYESIKALTFMMIENEQYAKYMINKRQEWKWWDTWLDQFCHRPTYIHNQNNQRLTENKIAFYMEKYIPLLQKYGIECQRAQNMQNMQQQQQHNNRGYNAYNNMQENYFNDDDIDGGAHGPGAGHVDAAYYDHDDADDHNNAGQQRQNSRDDSGDLYGNNSGDDVNDDGNEGDQQMIGPQPPDNNEQQQQQQQIMEDV